MTEGGTPGVGQAVDGGATSQGTGTSSHTGAGSGSGSGTGSGTGTGAMGSPGDSGVGDVSSSESGSQSSTEAGTSSLPDSGFGEGSGTEAAPDDSSVQMQMDLGAGDGSDVVLIGDSWMSNTLQVEGTGGGIAPSLIQVSGQPYRNYGVQGVMLLQADSFGPAIPSQYETAKQVNPNIKTVVMTGGGNDIIQNAAVQADCQAGGSLCKMTLDQITQALNTLWTEMAGDGVHDIVYIRYSDNVSSVAPSLRGDAGIGTPSICTTGMIRCWSVDTNNAVMSDIAADGIHPLLAANQRIAMQVYALMGQEGMRR